MVLVSPKGGECHSAGRKKVRELARTQQKVKVVAADKAMAGVLALLVADREERLANGDDGEPEKTEVILAGAGFDAPEIAGLVRKQVPTVRKAIERARKKGTAKRRPTTRK